MITCDPAARELILHWSLTERFVLKADLGPTKLLVKKEAVALIQQKLKEHNDELNFTAKIDATGLGPGEEEEEGEQEIKE